MIGKFLNISPKIAPTSFIAPSAQLIGAVEVGEHSSIWFNTVARADINKIRIGAYTNIQDGCILHVDDDNGLDIADYITIGHGAVLHACEIEDYALIGMGAIILNSAKIGRGAIVAAGALVVKGFKVPDYMLVMGRPAKVIRPLTKEERKENIYWAEKYAKLILEYKRSGKRLWKTKRS